MAVYEYDMRNAQQACFKRRSDCGDGHNSLVRHCYVNIISGVVIYLADRTCYCIHHICASSDVNSVVLAGAEQANAATQAAGCPPSTSNSPPLSLSHTYSLSSQIVQLHQIANCATTLQVSSILPSPCYHHLECSTITTI